VDLQAAGVIQVALFIYLIASLIISLRRVYGVSWPIATIKAIAILIGYMALVAVMLEAASPFTMPDSQGLPFLTD
jgi:hypothetical protein